MDSQQKNKFSFMKLFINFTWIIYLILFLIASLGVVLMLSEKNSATVTLSSIGSFLGGVFTILAFVFAIKEYKTIQSLSGAKEFRAFINDILYKSSSKIIRDIRMLELIHKKSANYTEEKKIEKIHLLSDLMTEYRKIQYEIVKFSADFSYYNDNLHKTIDPLLEELSNIIDDLGKGLSYEAKQLAPQWSRGRVPMPKLIKEYEDGIISRDVSLMKRIRKVTNDLSKIKANSI
ncbi:hypothetical protein AUR67_10475 [Pseudoalteromonas sp. XI10]|uniref:hypothetical protein n=1 Tax=Pseudoalteromonas sp. XI10 TaxID=1766621 RepID=UPI000733A0AE|nr:hypothetical protein [Pseudoalteromonas sp. XI10]KTG20586.1 hypothetical protein AUR67_10475 [Pseudoalteromonas sp. XI10]